MTMTEVKRIAFDAIDSTNTYSKEMDGAVYDAPGGGSRPVLVTAVEQIAGRGRYGRSFHSPRGTGIYMTYSFRPAFPQTDSARTTLVTAAVVHQVLSRHTDDALTIKWVNDIYRRGRKLVGILVEGVPAVPGEEPASRSQTVPGGGTAAASNATNAATADPGAAPFDRLVIGIGANLYPAPVPPDLADKVGFLFDAAPEAAAAAEQVREAIIDEIAAGLTEAFFRDPYDPSGYIDSYKQHCFNYPDNI